MLFILWTVKYLDIKLSATMKKKKRNLHIMTLVNVNLRLQ